MKDEFKTWAQKKVDPEKRRVLLDDFQACSAMNTRHLERDIGEIVQEINEIFLYLLKHHLIDISLERWILPGFDDPKSLKKRAEYLKKALKRLYDNDLSTLRHEGIPKRKNLLVALKAELDKKIVRELDMTKCDYLFKEVIAAFVKTFPLLNDIIENSKERERMKVVISELSKETLDLFQHLIDFLNNISYIDSLINQLKTESYKIEDHLVREIVVRQKILTILGKQNRIKAGNFVVYFFTYAEFENFLDDRKIKLEESSTFSETYRYSQLISLFLVIHSRSNKRYVKLYDDLPKELQLDKAVSAREVKGAFKKEVYFNFEEHYVVMEDHAGEVRCISTAENFINEVVQFLTFHYFKGESFDKLTHSIVEPYFLNPLQFLSFTDYKKARSVSWQLVGKVLKKEYEQGDITKIDYNQIYAFMESGFQILRATQDGIAKEKKRMAKGESPKFLSLIKHPYLVHQLMMYILRLALFSEARAKFNADRQRIYSGRESGFEGSNTIAVHGYK